MSALSFWQRILKAVASREMFAAMESESRTWMAQCSNCKFERSIWELGGVRWRAAGSPRVYRACPNCNRKHWHTVYKKAG
ncbi:MAG: hypothetical protein DPW18_10170 [Chloroflexi bacterium]|nr:hypothetical protein [Chloroflexota bacterium]MDL1943344.1 hypothetical protein [Chloroflexi bacterium CFX2]